MVYLIPMIFSFFQLHPITGGKIFIDWLIFGPNASVSLCSTIKMCRHSETHGRRLHSSWALVPLMSDRCVFLGSSKAGLKSCPGRQGSLKVVYFLNHSFIWNLRSCVCVCVGWGAGRWLKCVVTALPHCSFAPLLHWYILVERLLLLCKLRCPLRKEKFDFLKKCMFW